MSAVINEKAFRTINEYIEKGKTEGGRSLVGGGADGEQGFFIEPTVIADVKPGYTIEQQEIFGPVLAVIKAKDYRRCFEDSERYAIRIDRRCLQPGRGEIESARREFHVGNLYLNRKCTGALWAYIRLADSICPARTPKRAAMIICCSSCRRNRLRQRSEQRTSKHAEKSAAN